MNKMKRNEKKERGRGGGGRKERKYRGKIPTFFRRVGREEEEKRIERNGAVSKCDSTCSIRRKKE